MVNNIRALVGVVHVHFMIKGHNKHKIWYIEISE